MGTFKQIEDMRDVMAAAPLMIDLGRRRPANAPSFGAGPRPVRPVVCGSPIRPGDPRLASIAGVDLATYVYVIKGAVGQGLRAGAVVARAQSAGVEPGAWSVAANGWPERLRADLSLAVHYSTLYEQARV